jgi:hypothetical protein
MNRLLVLTLLIPAIAVAKSPFDGSWKTRLDSFQFSGKPDSYEISDGMYACRSCAPPYRIKADGTDQPVPDHAYLDQESVKILNASTVEITDKKAGKIISVQTITVSADGAKFTGKFTSYVGEKPFSGSFTEKRVGPAGVGAHALSGSWMQDSVADMSDVARTVRLESTPNGLKMIWNGQTTDVKFDGREYPTIGDPGKTLVSFKKLSDTRLEETDRRQGKVFDIIVWTMAADGKSITYEDSDPVHGTKITSVLEKQP